MSQKPINIVVKKGSLLYKALLESLKEKSMFRFAASQGMALQYERIKNTSCLIDKLYPLQEEYFKLQLLLENVRHNPGVFGLVNINTSDGSQNECTMLVQQYLPFDGREMLLKYKERLQLELNKVEREIRIILNQPVI